MVTSQKYEILRELRTWTADRSSLVRPLVFAVVNPCILQRPWQWGPEALRLWEAATHSPSAGVVWSACRRSFQSSSHTLPQSGMLTQRPLVQFSTPPTCFHNWPDFLGVLTWRWHPSDAVSYWGFSVQLLSSRIMPSRSKSVVTNEFIVEHF